MDRAQTPTTASRVMRKRKAVEKLSRLDESVIRQAQARRLEALENDNYAAEREAQILAGEDEYEPGMVSDDEIAGTKRKQKKRSRARRSRSSGSKPAPKTGIERLNKSVAVALEEEHPEARPSAMVSLEQITARPSIYAERCFCSICGYEAAYTCLTCSARFCSIPCSQVHQETRCLKFMTNTMISIY